MTDTARYHVYTHTPRQFDPADHGINPESFNTPWGMPRIIFDGIVTIGEFRQIFGDRRHINDAMRQESHDSNNFTIRIFAVDVLANGTTPSHQSVLIDHLLETHGRPAISRREMQDRARDPSDISPDTLQFLLEKADDNTDPEEMDLAAVAAEMASLGITLHDLLRPAPDTHRKSSQPAKPINAGRQVHQENRAAIPGRNTLPVQAGTSDTIVPFTAGK